MLSGSDLAGATKELGPFARLVVPALVTLIPAGVTAAVKTLQDRTHIRRSADLTDRICKLTKDISELPELPSSGADLPVSPRTALLAELNAAICEITALRSRPAHRAGDVSTSLATNLRSALLLYRPKGFLALSLHVTFYLYTLVMVCFLFSMAVDKDTGLIHLHPVSEFTIDMLLFVMLTGIFSIPSVILRNYAARIHRRQAPDLQPAPPSTAPIAAIVPGHGD